jgi:hypothetical protein
MCWRTAIAPQCLRVETINEVHLFPYGYFQHAKYFHQDIKDILEIQFQGRTIIAKGKSLQPLCDALARLAVEQIQIRPAKYRGLTKNESIIEEIEVIDKKQGTADDFT